MILAEQVLQFRMVCMKGRLVLDIGYLDKESSVSGV